MGALTGLLLGLGAIASTGAGIYQANKNYQAQKEANETNIKLQEMANEQNMLIQQQANAASAAEAQKNRDWQTEMSNTAHQREMADLKAAGLNPILAATGGATTGSGGVATIDAANVNSAKVSAPQINLNSVTNLIQSLSTAALIGSFYKQQRTNSAATSNAIANNAKQLNSANIAKQNAEKEKLVEEVLKLID